MTVTKAKKMTPAKTKKVTEKLARYNELRTQRLEASTEEADLQKWLLDNLPEDEILEFGNISVRKAPVARLNNERFSVAYPADLNPGLYKLAVDTAAVRRAVAKNDLEEFEDTSYQLKVAQYDG